MFDTLRNEKRPAYAAAIFSADLKAGITLTASFAPTVMALGVISGLGNPVAGAVGVLPGGGTIATMSARRFGGKTVIAGIVCLLILAALIFSRPLTAPAASPSCRAG